MNSLHKYKERLVARKRAQSITATLLVLVVAIVGVHVVVSSHACILLGVRWRDGGRF
jgi:hypothetical protein